MSYTSYSFDSVPYSNSYYSLNSSRQFGPGRPPRPMGPPPRPPFNNSFGSFALPFALGLVSSPLLVRPNYYPNYYRPPFPYYY